MRTNDQAVHFYNWIKNHYDFPRATEAFLEFKKERYNHAATSPGPINCNIRKIYQGELAVTACERCHKADDCPFFTRDGEAK